MNIVIDSDAVVASVTRTRRFEDGIAIQGLEIAIEDNETGYRWRLTFEDEEIARRLAREILAAYE